MPPMRKGRSHSRMDNSPTNRATDSRFFSVPIDAIHTDGLGFDLYLIHERGEAVLYRSSGAPYDLSDCDQLREQGIENFYVPNDQHRQFQAAMSGQMRDAYANPELEREDRVRIVRDTCAKLVEDFTNNPAFPGLSDTMAGIAGMLSAWCGEGDSQFGYLLDMAARDFATTTHMVNVGVGCTLLAAELLGPDHDLVRQMALGGLIHDVGKRDVPGEVLVQEGKLAQDEWELLRDHPASGANVLRELGGISEVAIDMVMNHHERFDGRGYPSGLEAEAISMPARICSVVDVYDALTASRPFRDPIAPAAVLEIMRRDAGRVFDPEVYSAWERVVERLLAQDPSRAVPFTGDRPRLPLDAFIPSPVAQVRPALGVMVVRCRGGAVHECPVVDCTRVEVVLACDASIKPGDPVLLCPEMGPEEIARYVCPRFGSHGEPLMVFKITRTKDAAA